MTLPPLMVSIMALDCSLAGPGIPSCAPACQTSADAWGWRNPPVHHDGALAGIAVLAGTEAVETQGVTVLALIGLGGAVDPRELCREFI